MAQRKEMAQEIINLTDTDAFSELKDVFDEMNQGLLDFENQMSPLTEILDAVYALRLASDGAMFDVFKEIQDDKQEEERVALLRSKQDRKLTELSDHVESLRNETEILRQQKSWFGLGGTKKSALLEIDKIQNQIGKKKSDIDTLVIDIENTRVNRDTQFSQFAEEKPPTTIFIFLPWKVKQNLNTLLGGSE